LAGKCPIAIRRKWTESVQRMRRGNKRDRVTQSAVDFTNNY